MFFAKNKEKKEYYKFLIRKISRSIWDMELRIITIKEIREGIRIQFDKLSADIKAMEEVLVKEKKQKKIDMKKIEKIVALKEKYKVDAERLKEQMIGKFIKEEKIFGGGIDQEVKTIEGKIEGGKSFRGLIKKELKRL